MQMQAMVFEWWLRPVSMHERVSERSAAVCMMLESNQPLARLSRLGAVIGLPKHPSGPNPTSSGSSGWRDGARQ